MFRFGSSSSSYSYAAVVAMDLETYLVVAAMAVAIAVVAQTGLSGLLSSSFSSVASKITDHSANPKL